jgi:hypothetical protein
LIVDNLRRAMAAFFKDQIYNAGREGLSQPSDDITQRGKQSEKIWKMAGERPAFSLDGPCFTRHILFRLRKDENPRYIEGNDVIDNIQIETRWDQIVYSVNKLIGEFRKISSVNLANPVVIEDLKGESFNSIKSTVMREIRPSSHSDGINEKFRIRIRVDVYSESIGITIASDQFSEGEIFTKLNSSDDFNNIKFIYDLWDSNHVIFGQFNKLLNEIKFPFENMIGDFRGVMIPGVDHTIKNLDNLDNAPMHLQASKGIVDNVKKIIENRKNKNEAPIVKAAQDSEGDKEKYDHNIKIHSDSYSAIESCTKNNQFISEKIVNFCKKSGNIIDEFLKIREYYDKSSADSVMCTFLNGNVLYCAPLASNRLDQGESECGIVKYLIVYGDIKGDQLGRLVRRLHILGELRYLALLDYKLENGEKDLKTVSNDLRHIGNKLDDYVKDNEKNPILPMKLIEDINLLLSKTSLISDGSLIYRISQSRYYANTFKEQIGDLRIEKIEGYQSYDQFIRRNVYQLFSKIDQIGQRYDLLGRRVERWILMSEADTSRKLLDNAENFATVFLVYYGGVVIEKFLKEGLHVLSTDTGKYIYYCIWFSILLAVIVDVMGRDKRITMYIYRSVSKGMKVVFGFVDGLWEGLRKGGRGAREAIRSNVKNVLKSE